MKKYSIVFAVLVVALFSTTVFAGYPFMSASDAVPVDEINGKYTAPKVVKSVRPDRVFYAPNREVEGFVTLEMLVNEKGEVERARAIYRTSRLAVPKAVEAANDWKFEPATINGSAVKSWVAYNLPFGRDLDTFAEASYTDKVIVDDDVLAFLK